MSNDENEQRPWSLHSEFVGLDNGLVRMDHWVTVSAASLPGMTYPFWNAVPKNGEQEEDYPYMDIHTYMERVVLDQEQIDLLIEMATSDVPTWVKEMREDDENPGVFDGDDSDV